MLLQQQVSPFSSSSSSNRMSPYRGVALSRAYSCWGPSAKGLNRRGRKRGRRGRKRNRMRERSRDTAARWQQQQQQKRPFEETSIPGDPVLLRPAADIGAPLGAPKGPKRIPWGPHGTRGAPGTDNLLPLRPGGPILTEGPYVLRASSAKGPRGPSPGGPWGLKALDGARGPPDLLASH